MTTHSVLCAMSMALAFVLTLGVNTPTNARLVAQDIDPIQLYGTSLTFDVIRNGKKIGTHKVSFENVNDELIVQNRTEMKIDFIVFTAYRFEYDAVSHWRNGELVYLDTRVDDDGKSLEIRANKTDRGLRVESDGQMYSIQGPIFPTNHWNARVVEQNRVLNTLTGNLNNVIVLPMDRELVQTNSGEIMARRYAYTGDLETEVWYDDSWRWVKMRFKGRDGSLINYVCTNCQGPGAKQVQQ